MTTPLPPLTPTDIAARTYVDQAIAAHIAGGLSVVDSIHRLRADLYRRETEISRKPCAFVDCHSDAVTDHNGSWFCSRHLPSWTR